MRITRVLRDGTEVDDGGAEVGDVLEAGNGSAKIAFRAEGVEPEFVDGGAVEPLRDTTRVAVMEIEVLRESGGWKEKKQDGCEVLRVSAGFQDFQEHVQDLSFQEA